MLFLLNHHSPKCICYGLDIVWLCLTKFHVLECLVLKVAMLKDDGAIKRWEPVGGDLILGHCSMKARMLFSKDCILGLHSRRVTYYKVRLPNMLDSFSRCHFYFCSSAMLLHSHRALTRDQTGFPVLNFQLPKLWAKYHFIFLIQFSASGILLWLKEMDSAFQEPPDPQTTHMCSNTYTSFQWQNQSKERLS